MSTHSVQLLVSVNGGAATSGGITIPASCTIQFSFGNTSGWDKYRLELMVPIGGSIPAGWTNENGLAVYTGVTAPPPAITFPAITSWGKWFPVLIVNDGLLSGAVNALMTDSSTILSMLSANGIEDLAPRESTQLDSLRSWASPIQKMLRTVDGISTSGAPLATTPPPDIGAATLGVATKAAREDHTHATPAHSLLTTYVAGALATKYGTVFTSLAGGNLGRHHCDQRYWSAPLGNGVYDLKWFGAVGDGVTDDTVAIQAWFDAVAFNSGLGYGGRGFAGPGIYRYTGEIKFLGDASSKSDGLGGTTVNQQSNCTFVGVNSNAGTVGSTVFLCDTPPHKAGFKIYSRGVRFENMIFTVKSGPVYAGHVLTKSTAASPLIVTDIVFKNCFWGPLNSTYSGWFVYPVSMCNDPADIIWGTSYTNTNVDFIRFESCLFNGHLAFTNLGANQAEGTDACVRGWSPAFQQYGITFDRTTFYFAKRGIYMASGIVHARDCNFSHIGSYNEHDGGWAIEMVNPSGPCTFTNTDSEGCSNFLRNRVTTSVGGASMKFDGMRCAPIADRTATLGSSSIRNFTNVATNGTLTFEDCLIGPYPIAWNVNDSYPVGNVVAAVGSTDGATNSPTWNPATNYALGAQVRYDPPTWLVGTAFLTGDPCQIIDGLGVTKYFNAALGNTGVLPPTIWNSTRTYAAGDYVNGMKPADYSAATAYVLGDTVYVPSTGLMWRCKSATTGLAPVAGVFWETWSGVYASKAGANLNHDPTTLANAYWDSVSTASVVTTWTPYVNLGKYYVCNTGGAGAGITPATHTGTWDRLEVHQYVQYVTPAWLIGTTYAANQCASGVATLGASDTYNAGTAYVTGDPVSITVSGTRRFFFSVAGSTGVAPTALNPLVWTEFSGYFYSKAGGNLGNNPTALGTPFWYPSTANNYFRAIGKNNKGKQPSEQGSTYWQALPGFGTAGTPCSEELRFRFGSGALTSGAVSPHRIIGCRLPSPRLLETDLVECDGYSVRLEDNVCTDLLGSGTYSGGFPVKIGDFSPVANGLVVMRNATDKRALVNNSMQRVTGLSASRVSANNLNGFVTETGAVTTGAVTFADNSGVATPETDTNYEIVATNPPRVTGGATTGKVSILTKSTTGFTYSYDAAPGAGVVNWAWMLIRYFV